MNAAELVEVALEIGNRLDVQWGLFVTVHMALLGSFAYIDKPLHRAEKAIVLIVYLGFAVVNFGQMQSQLELLNAAYADINQLVLEGDTGALVERIADEHTAGRHRFSEIVVRVSHTVLLILVLVTVVYHPLVDKSQAET